MPEDRDGKNGPPGVSLSSEGAPPQDAEWFRAAFDFAPIGMLLVGTKRKILKANRAFCLMLGYSEGEIAGRSISDLTHPDDVSASAQEIQRLHKGESSRISMEKRYLRKDGGLIWCRLTTTLVRDSKDGISNALAMVEDISERKQREDSLQLHASVLENMAEGVGVVDARGRILLVNPAFERMLGYDRGELVGRKVSHIADATPESIGRTMRDIFQAVKDRGFWEGELPNRKKSGEPLFSWARIARLGEASDVAVGVLQDVTAKVRAEANLRESEERFRVAFDLAPIGMALVGLDQTFQKVNHAFCSMLGYSPDEIVGKAVFDITYPEDVSVSREETRRLAIGEIQAIRLEKRYVRKDGSTIWGRVTATLIRDGKGIPLRSLAMLEDVTESKRAEEAVRESEARFRAAFEGAPIGVMIVGPDLRILRANQTLCRVLGYTESELVGRSVADITPPEDIGETLQTSRQLFEGKFRVLRREKRYRRKDGQAVLCQLSATLVMDSAGRPSYAIGMIEDISERKRTESDLLALQEGLERRVQERTLQLEVAINELEAFSYSISHDLRAPVRAMAGFAGIALEEHAEALSPEVRRYLEKIRTNAGQMDRLIEDLLAFSGIGRAPLRIGSCDPASIARAAFEGLEGERGGRDIEVQFGDLPACRADAGLLYEVFANLLSNAIKFTRPRPEPLIEIGARPADGPGSGIAYFVRDNGVGFDMRHAQKLFGVFQRLHRIDEFEGTGLGLAIVKRIVEGHGGRIWAESSPDRGAVFFFTLGKGDGDA